MQYDTGEAALSHPAIDGAFATTLPAPLQVGYRFSRVHRFDPAQVSAFAHAAGDTNPIHHDAHAAARTRFGKTIASGTHTTALLLGLVASHLSGLGQVLGVKFSTELLRPVFADEEVQLEWEVVAIQPHPKGGYFLDLTGWIRGGEGDCRVRALGRVLMWR
jgi:3-hydroxybutyryl-CoA dehydratase